MADVKELIDGLRELCSKAHNVQRHQGQIDYTLYLQIEVARATLDRTLNSISHKIERAA